MLTSVTHPAPRPLSSIAPNRTPEDRAQQDRTHEHRTPESRGQALSRIDGIDVRLRRLVDSSEPAVVFSSLVRLCVPAFSDACVVDIVEGGRVRYRVGNPQGLTGGTPALPYAERSVVTAFGCDLPGWASYTGVMTSSWYTHRSTTEDADRAAAIVDHAVRMIRSERLSAPLRSGRASSAAARERWTQPRAR